MYQDKNLTCVDCGNTFVFTANEQEFYAEKGFENEPKRCPECRSARKQKFSGSRNSGNKREREMFTTTCSNCGATTQVPFKPNGSRPVYCRDCFDAQKNNNY